MAGVIRAISTAIRVYPGSAVWQANAPDGTVGCFDLPPGQAMVNYTAVRDVAGHLFDGRGASAAYR